MTLKVTSSQIQIKNSAGTIKFTSDDKLVYQKYFQTGTLTVGAATLAVNFPATTSSKDFLVVSVIVNSCTGSTSITSALVNNLIPANGGIVVDFDGRNVSNAAAADTEILSIGQLGTDLIFKSNRFTYESLMVPGRVSTNLTYYARMLSYL